MPLPIRSFIFIIITLASLFPIHFSPDVVHLSTQQSTPNYEQAPCMFTMPVGAVEGTDVQCGYLTVPARHNIPDGPKIRLAVATVKSKTANPKQDPLVMAQGGPGGATIDTYINTLLSGSKLRSDRDIILFDQRGTGYSLPSLNCPEYYTMLDQTIEKNLSTEESSKLSDQAMLSCRERLINSGINLSAFNSLENAADINDLRNALGLEKINLYGVSYGTLLALHTLKAFPEGLRSVIIDSVVPPQTNFLLGAPKAEDRSFTKLFSACAENPICNKAYPNLENVFFNLVEKLNNNPVSVPMTDAETGKKYNAFFNGDSLMGAVFQMMYATQLIPLLPKAIYKANQGDFSFFGSILSLLIFDRSMSFGMYYSVICSEEAGYTIEDLKLDGIRPQVAKGQKESAASLLELCKKWNVEQLDPQVNLPVSSDLPVLVLAGEFDPITPPDYARQAASTLKNSFTVVFPSGGHGAATSGDCQDQTILNFLDNPKQAPDVNCLANQTTPDFLTPKNTLMIPYLKNLLTLDLKASASFILLIISLILLLTACLVWPIIWLVKLIRKTKSHVTWLGHLTHLAGILAGLLTLSFLIGFIIIGIQMISKNDLIFFFGIHANNGWLFVLPLLVLFATIFLCVGTIISWAKKYRSLGERIYDSLISISALVCILILAYSGIISALWAS